MAQSDPNGTNLSELRTYSGLDWEGISRTSGSRDAAEELTRMYSQRVLESPSQSGPVQRLLKHVPFVSEPRQVFQYSALGSSASCSPSPRKLKEMTVMKINIPG